MASELPWWRNVRVWENSPSLCPTMFSVMKIGRCCLPLWMAKVSPTNSGRIIERRDQVLIGCLRAALFMASAFLSRDSSTNGPFLMERPMVYFLRLTIMRLEDL